MEREVSRTVAVILDRRPARSRWVDHVWRVAEVLDGGATAEPFTLLATLEDGSQRYFAGNAEVTLHRAETEAYRTNLTGDRVIYVALRSDPAGARPFRVHKATASPYDACSMLDSGEEMVEAAPMPPVVLAWVEAFCRAHHKEKPFVKRPRGRLDVEEVKFSQEPIFMRTRRASVEPDRSDG